MSWNFIKYLHPGSKSHLLFLEERKKSSNTVTEKSFNICRYIEVMESKLSVMDRVKRDEGAGGSSGGEDVDQPSGLSHQKKFEKVDKEIKCGHHLYCRSLTSSSGGRGGGGASRGRVSEFCVRMRGLPWESTKVSQIFLYTDLFQNDQLIS